MKPDTYELLRGFRLRNALIEAAIAAGLFAWAIGIADTEFSDLGSAPYRAFAAVGCVFMAGVAISELIGLRNIEIVVSEGGISTPHGLGRRTVFVGWSEVAQFEVFPIRRGEILALTRLDGSTVRIGLREVDRPSDLVAAVKTRLALHGDGGM